MMYSLPKSVELSGIEYAVRSDFRAILDIIAALNDPDLTQQEKTYVSLFIFYVEANTIPQADMREAMDKLMWFINCGEPIDDKPRPVLMDWEQDFPLIVAPINRTLGFECRSAEYLHWWTFISAYYEIGECAFSTLVGIRQKLKRGKKLDKWEQEYYREHRDMVTLKKKVSKADKELLDDILG